MSGLRVRIGHLYPDLNVTGDRGNVLALVQRCRWRGLSPATETVSLGDVAALADFDVLCIGGGQDRQLDLMVRDLMATKGAALAEAVAGGVVLLAVGGAFQALGRTYVGHDGVIRPGLGLLDCETEADGVRHAGNVATAAAAPGWTGNLVGFENHSGRTWLGPAARPLGHVLAGYGNNGQDRTEGLVQGSAFATFLHGAVLPRNPAFADYLLGLALQRRYPGAVLRDIDDSLEHAAGEAMLRRLRGGSAVPT